MLVWKYMCRGVRQFAGDGTTYSACPPPRRSTKNTLSCPLSVSGAADFTEDFALGFPSWGGIDTQILCRLWGGHH